MNSLKLLTHSLAILALIIPLAARAAPGGLPAIQESVDDLENAVDVINSEIDSLEEGVSALNFSVVNVDCSADDTALQAAIDVAPAAGVNLLVTGQCSSTAVHGKSNIIIDGGGSASVFGNPADGLVASLYIEASRNITVQGFDVYANGNDHALAGWNSSLFIYQSSFHDGTLSSLDISRGTSAAIADIEATGSGNAAFSIANNASVISDGSLTLTNTSGKSLSIVSGGSIVQASGAVDITGEIALEFGATAFLTAGDITAAAQAIVVSRNSTMTLNAVGPVTVSGNIQAFSASNLDIRSVGGSVALSGGSILIQRNSSMMVATANIPVSMDFGIISARQNAVLDFLSADFVNTPIVQLILGSGMRLFNEDPLTANCDGSAWTFGVVSCGP